MAQSAGTVEKDVQTSKYSTSPPGYSDHFVLKLCPFGAPGVGVVRYSPFMFSNGGWVAADPRDAAYHANVNNIGGTFTVNVDLGKVKIRWYDSVMLEPKI